MKKYLMAAVMSCTSLMGLAKSNPDVTGLITDQEGNPMSFVNVVLLALPDSSFVQGSTSDENGHFNITTLEGKGVLKVSSVGYETVYMNMSDFSGSIQMHEDDRILSDVVVKAQLPKTKLTGNSMVTSIEGSVLGQSGTAAEMLAKVPGMTQKGDDLEVLGRGKPVFYVNGRKVQNLDEFKRLHSDEIKSVEVITNPGAQYDATVTAVVRITTRKRQGNGFGFDLNAADNFDLNYGYNDPSGTVNLRYRHNNLDFFGMANYWEWSTANISEPKQKSYLPTPDGVMCIEQDAYMRHDWHGRGLDFNAGFNWQISDNHSVGIRVEQHDQLKGETPMWQRDDISQYIIGKESEAVHTHDNSSQFTRESQPYNWEGNAYYNGRVGKLGIDLNIDFKADKTQEENEIQEDGKEPMNTVSPLRNNLWASKLVLSYPVWKGQLEMGSEVTLVNRSTSYTIQRRNASQATVEGGSVIPNTSSKVNENNIAAFAQYAFSLDNWGNFSAGVRYEHVGFDYTDRIDGQKSMTRYTDDFFPSASWSNQFGAWQTALSYSYKTSRPNYWMLNESMIYINPYALQTGDPTLKNERIQEVSVNARYKVFSLMAAYERRDDALSQWSYIYNDKGVMLIKNINLPVPQRNLAIFISANPTFGCYNMNWTAGAQRYWSEQTLADPREASGSRVVKPRNPIAFFMLNNAFRLKHSWQLECNSTIYTTGDVLNYTMTTPMYNINFVVQKCWLKNDALCLRATLSDVLHHSYQGIRMDCGYYILNQTQKRNSSRLNLTMRYTFNATQSKYKGTGAGREAANRMSK